MKIISWNVAGLSACIKKGFFDFLNKENPDIICLQEIKSDEEKLNRLFKDFGNYNRYYSTAKKKGYSGVLTLSKIKPLSVIYGIDDKEIDQEGRVVSLEFQDYFLINAYFPHSNRELSRLDFKLSFNKKFADFSEKLRKSKPIVIAADFNVAHKDIDLTNPKPNKNNAGFTIQERRDFDNFLSLGYIDTFREFNKSPGNYTWWTYRNNARQRNIGWRIDYFVISKELRKKLNSSLILKEILGSDHCPISLSIF